MNEPSYDDWGERLLAVTRELPYPPTPDLSAHLRERLTAKQQVNKRPRQVLAWIVAGVIVLFLAAVMMVPSVRASVLEFLQVGVVRIFQVEPTPTLTATYTPVTAAPAQQKASPQPPTPTAIRLASLLELRGEVTLEQAVERLDFDLLLPSYPAGIGLPDRVYMQDQDGQVLILVWTDPDAPDRAVLSLHAITPGSWAITKMNPAIVEHTRVNGGEAVWAVGPYPVRLTDGDLDFRRLVEGNVLIWEQDGITYRLESDLTLEEAVEVAESLYRLPVTNQVP